MTNHTPGPWGISYDDLSIDDSQMKAVWLTCEDYTYANIGQLYIRADEKEEDTANANLIAAAPELLEALEYAVSKYGKEGGPWNVPGDAGGWLDRSRKAIAKATGEE
jgi:hypothetical protein